MLALFQGKSLEVISDYNSRKMINKYKTRLIECLKLDNIKTVTKKFCNSFFLIYCIFIYFK
ncbi:unknown [Fusobacterium nucleatum subsp. nucleatum ATCC 25586]|uniref:Uncharacterized protein n=1 Tax=Fusobacterium nucleatum subsp. nucleatum (strain ATCC 25586 / DSM 15643 / BCRC 10681 / CIP 101130 / JCM 8532 / KCTC 2640 / LMG 13131 / VPI 4355) TaxID=190304 RepID=Q8RE17_FUSNN|nr:unknown [Fusobacterium nucleatum subsp. nucleatum ATCC 25586]